MEINPENIEVVAKLLLAAAQDKNWSLAVALGLIVLVWAARKFGAAKVPWLKTDIGGVVTTLLLAWGGAVASALLAGQPVSWALVGVAFGVAFKASGGYAMVKKVLWPLIAKKLGLEPKKEEAAVVKQAQDAGVKAVKEVKAVKFEDLGK